MPDDPEPDPATTAGLDRGGAAVQGDTPPMAASQSEAAEDSGRLPNQAPARSSRTPAVLTIGIVVAFAVVVVVVLILTLVVG